MARFQDRRQVFITAVTLLLIIAVMIIPLPLPASAAGESQIRDITVDARTFAYAPSVISVHRGDTIHLTLAAVDAAHGLSIDGYDVNLQAEPGKSAELTFTADKDGKFRFRCSLTCGPLHPFMIGELDVDSQFPLARALAAGLIATIGAVLFFWRSA